MCHITVLQWVFQQDHKRFQSLRKMWFTMSHLWFFQIKTFSERMMRPWWSPSPGRDCNQMIIFPPVKLGDVLEQAFYCTPSYFALFCASYFVFRALLCFTLAWSLAFAWGVGSILGLTVILEWHPVDIRASSPQISNANSCQKHQKTFAEIFCAKYQKPIVGAFQQISVVTDTKLIRASL